MPAPDPSCPSCPPGRTPLVMTEDTVKESFAGVVAVVIGLVLLWHGALLAALGLVALGVAVIAAARRYAVVITVDDADRVLRVRTTQLWEQSEECIPFDAVDCVQLADRKVRKSNAPDELATDFSVHLKGGRCLPFGRTESKAFRFRLENDAKRMVESTGCRLVHRPIGLLDRLF